MARKPIFTEEEIIEAGKALEAELGAPVSGWQIHQTMGGVGRPSRVEEAWQRHLSKRESAAKNVVEVPLPRPLQGSLETAVERLQVGVEKLLRDQRRSLIEEHQRQLELQQRDHADELAKAQAEVERHRHEVIYLRSLLDADEEVEDEPE